MNERELLLRAVCENPDEDTPRLVLADWLEENGDPEYAEFIRSQVRFAALLRDAAATDGPAQRARELWVLHAGRWRADLPQVAGLKWHDAFYRGFPERAVAASETVVVANEARIFDEVPIRHLVLTTFGGTAEFTRLRGLRRLKTLTVTVRRLSRKAADALAGCETLPESALVFCNYSTGAGELVAELRRTLGDRISLRTW